MKILSNLETLTPTHALRCHGDAAVLAAAAAAASRCLPALTAALVGWILLSPLSFDLHGNDPTAER